MDKSNRIEPPECASQSKTLLERSIDYLALEVLFLGLQTCLSLADGPAKAIALPPVNGLAVLNLIFLKFTIAEEMGNLLEPFMGEDARH